MSVKDGDGSEQGSGVKPDAAAEAPPTVSQGVHGLGTQEVVHVGPERDVDWNGRSERVYEAFRFFKERKEKKWTRRSEPRRKKKMSKTEENNKEYEQKLRKE